MLARVNDLINDCRRSPFKGLGKPEPLRGDLQGWWSRRINTEDRLVYRVTGKPPDQALEIAQCRFHYWAPVAHQNRLPGTPLKGPATAEVIQPP
jgi:toxin YoeB